jgi:elongation factor P
MITATQIRKGMTIVIDGQLYRVLEAAHTGTARGQAYIQTKLRNLKDQTLLDYRFNSKDKIEQAYLETVEMEFLYKSEGQYVFMNLENYEQITLSEEMISENIYYLVPNVVFMMEMYEGKPVGLQPPITVDLKVVKTEPYLKGATQASSSKPATLETGLKISVPPFIEEGDIIRIDTRENKYLERVSRK